MSGWIRTDEEMPEMKDAGSIAKGFGVEKMSDTVLITLWCEDGSRIVDSNATLIDGKWRSDKADWLNAAHKDFEIVAWMPLPEPFREVTG